jgi:hypothetical protein
MGGLFHISGALERILMIFYQVVGVVVAALTPCAHLTVEW